MLDVKNGDLIPINLFDICLIDDVSKKEILELYPSRNNGAYYLNKFENYLLNKYHLSLKDYCKKYIVHKWPICSKTNKEYGFRISGLGIKINLYIQGQVNKENCEAFRLGCEKLSQERYGENNPMFGKLPWNKGKDKSDPIIKKMAERRTGSKTSEAVRLKQSISAKKRKIHGHTGCSHSLETKEKMRLHSASLWSRGVFSRVSSIHIKMREFLNTLSLKEAFQEEFQVKYFSMDFAFPASKIAIECNGTFFHVDPRIYPNGPINAIQRRNFGRDKAKRKVCCDQQGWIIIEVWETEINDGTFKEFLKCRLLELNLLNQ